MELQDFFRACHLMETIDILCHHCHELTGLFQPSQIAMGCIGLGIWIEQVFLIEVEKFLWITRKHGMGDQLLGCQMPSYLNAIDTV